MALRLATLAVCVFAVETLDVAPLRHPTCLRFYSLEGDVKPDALRKAVAALGTKGAEATLVSGPQQVSSRPKAKFVVLELPSKVAPKEVLAALKKTSTKVDELAWTAFRGEDRKLPDILGFSGLECVVGMDNDLRWFDLEGGLARFFYVPGKLDAEDLRKRFHKLYEPFKDGEVGELLRGRLEWKLAGPIEPAAAKAAEKALAKLPGVRKPKIDVAAATLSAEIEHDGLRAAARQDGGSGAGGSERLPASGFHVDGVLDALDALKLALE